MLTATRQTKAGTIRRTVAIGIDRETLQCVAVVSEIKIGKRTNRTQTDAYTLRRFPSEIGGFAVEAIHHDDGEIYHVLFNGCRPGCDCAWGSYCPDGKECRHVEMARQAIRQRLI